MQIFLSAFTTAAERSSVQFIQSESQKSNYSETHERKVRLSAADEIYCRDRLTYEQPVKYNKHSIGCEAQLA